MEEHDKLAVGGSSERFRDYRKGNWTVQETLILIEAKKMDDQRRKITKKHSQQQQPSSPSLMLVKPAVTELRWKWVEDYCWKKGCYRSQNQCNDKWDNLMRDYKKVRDYQRNTFGNAAATVDEMERESYSGNKSYWKMDKVDRKNNGLPTNMLAQIYQALYDVVERNTSSLPSPVVPPLLLPAPQRPAPLSPLSQLRLQPVPMLDPEKSEHTHSVSPAKKMKMSKETGGNGAAVREGSSGAATTEAGPSSSVPQPPSLLQDVELAISKIAESIEASQEKEERRHREMMSLHEMRLRLEETRLEMHRQSLHDLADAIHKLANSIFTWANSPRKDQGPP